MSNNIVQPLGPLFGPDFITISVNDETGAPYALEIFPDANNPELNANGLPTQFYYMPKQVNLAKRLDSPEDYDFSFTLFKGLMTEEDTIGVSGLATAGGNVEVGGGFLSFSTTMAVPESVINNTRAMLQNGSHDAPPSRVASFFAIGQAAPLLGIVPIVDNKVTIEVLQSLDPGEKLPPIIMSAQGTGQGSIDAAGVSSFLVSCNQNAAGLIAGALEDGNCPITIHYNLKLLFYINACNIEVDIDLDKVYTQFSADAKVGYAFTESELSANYQRCITSGGITTKMTMDGVDIDPDIKQMIEKQVSDMQNRAWEKAKDQIFDWKPKTDDPAQAKSSGPCGGASVSVKVGYQETKLVTHDQFELSQTVTKLDTISGTLTALGSVIKNNLSKYRSIVDIGNFFGKIQVAASPNINFDDSPIQEALIEVSYPDNTAAQNGQLSLTTRVNGFHYDTGNIDRTAAVTLARWTHDNPRDIINISFLKMDNDLPGWTKNTVKIRKTLIYKTNDSRVDLSGNNTSISIEETSADHNPVVDDTAVGYIFISFALDRAILAPNITVTLTVQIGDRTDVLQLVSDKLTKKPTAELKIWSDKYFNVDVAKVKIDVEAAPPPNDFAAETITWSGTQAVPIGLGRVKKIVPFIINLPKLSDTAQNDLVAKYILETQKELLAATQAEMNP
ncbi:hypothetical protein HGH93_12175 [Chitinophaga polysaccharea]|uniref:hypothetical protein n=1 Tax=Chitinophaga polysaccharea TaxID=1293035 RepID=UPI00145509EC|nr:hypothetical protein [Chitinophaga polysaccharea]NLR58864.1 hypothetical protein [Chitinophaga polysaccharea]